MSHSTICESLRPSASVRPSAKDAIDVTLSWCAACRSPSRVGAPTRLTSNSNIVCRLAEVSGVTRTVTFCQVPTRSAGRRIECRCSGWLSSRSGRSSLSRGPLVRLLY
jgi:hypothetical protein